jgi:hypothetical protein
MVLPQQYFNELIGFGEILIVLSPNNMVRQIKEGSG